MQLVTLSTLLEAQNGYQLLDTTPATSELWLYHPATNTGGTYLEPRHTDVTPDLYILLDLNNMIANSQPRPETSSHGQRCT